MAVDVAEASVVVNVDPAHFRVLLTTTKGDITLEARREWAPYGVDRLREMVASGFFAGEGGIGPLAGGARRRRPDWLGGPFWQASFAPSATLCCSLASTAVRAKCHGRAGRLTASTGGAGHRPATVGAVAEPRHPGRPRRGEEPQGLPYVCQRRCGDAPPRPLLTARPSSTGRFVLFGRPQHAHNPALLQPEGQPVPGQHGLFSDCQGWRAVALLASSPLLTAAAAALARYLRSAWLAATSWTGLRWATRSARTRGASRTRATPT